MSDEELDACSVSFDTDKNTSDDDIDALALFADIDFTDPAAVEARRVEWEELASIERRRYESEALP